MLQPGIELVVERFSNQARSPQAGWKTFFQRRLLELLATLANLKTFSTTTPRAGCNLSWLENLFDDISRRANCNFGCLESLFNVESSSWLQPRRKGFPTNSNRLKDSFVGKVPTSPGSKQLEDSSKRFSNKPRLQPARRLVVQKVL